MGPRPPICQSDGIQPRLECALGRTAGILAPPSRSAGGEVHFFLSAFVPSVPLHKRAFERPTRRPCRPRSPTTRQSGGTARLCFFAVVGGQSPEVIAEEIRYEGMFAFMSVWHRLHARGAYGRFAQHRPIQTTELHKQCPILVTFTVLVTILLPVSLCRHIAQIQ